MLPPTETVESSSGFKDRKAGLVIFGILTVAMGGVCALMVPMVFFAQAMAAKSGIPQSTHSILPAAMMYGGLAVVFVWLGIGSIMARRWARALLLVLSWSWLVIGVVSTGVVWFILPKALESASAFQPAGQPQPPLANSPVFLWIIMMFIAFIYVVVPGIGVLFYRSKHVKATCDFHDPAPSWTDRCPLPVIAVCLWLALTSLGMLMMAVPYHGIIPMFGTILSGPVGTALCVLMTLVFGYSAWAIYQLRWSGWWLVVVVMGLFAVSAFLTYSRHDINEVYALMGYSGQELALLQKMNLWNGHALAWGTLCGTVPFLGYMLYLRRYFPREAS